MQQANYHRVKVYKLNDTGGWDDKGTGLVNVGPLEVRVSMCVLPARSHDTHTVHCSACATIHLRQSRVLSRPETLAALSPPTHRTGSCRGRRRWASWS